MAAMRAKNSARAGVVRSLLSDYQYAQKNAQIAGKDPESVDLLSVVQKALVRRQEASAQFRAGDRGDLAEREESEAKVIQEFLPEPLSEAEISLIIQGVVDEADIDIKAKGALGKIMNAVSQKVDKVRAPPKIVSGLVRDLVNSEGNN